MRKTATPFFSDNFTVATSTSKGGKIRVRMALSITKISSSMKRCPLTVPSSSTPINKVPPWVLAKAMTSRTIFSG